MSNNKSCKAKSNWLVFNEEIVVHHPHFHIYNENKEEKDEIKTENKNNQTEYPNLESKCHLLSIPCDIFGYIMTFLNIFIINFLRILNKEFYALHDYNLDLGIQREYNNQKFGLLTLLCNLNYFPSCVIKNDKLNIEYISKLIGPFCMYGVYISLNKKFDNKIFIEKLKTMDNLKQLNLFLFKEWNGSGSYKLLLKQLKLSNRYYYIKGFIYFRRQNTSIIIHDIKKAIVNGIRMKNNWFTINNIYTEFNYHELGAIYVIGDHKKSVICQLNLFNNGCKLKQIDMHMVLFINKAYDFRNDFNKENNNMIEMILNKQGKFNSNLHFLNNN